MIDPAEVDGAEAPSVSVRLLRIDQDTKVIVRFRENLDGGMMCHWNGTRTVKCHGDTCTECRRYRRQQWRGYVAAHLWRDGSADWYPVVLEVTEHLELHFRGRSLQGEVWAIHRPAKIGKKHQPVTGRYLTTHPVDKIGAAWKVDPILQWLYGPGVHLLTKKNPLPPKLFLAAVQGMPPPAELSQRELEEIERQATREDRKKNCKGQSVRDRFEQRIRQDNGQDNGQHNGQDNGQDNGQHNGQ